MPVLVVPNDEVLLGGTSFTLNPAPTVPLYQDTPRFGVNPILYETISPTMTLTVQGGDCGGVPELITSLSLVPGSGSGNSGSGCNIVSLANIADRPVNDIPEFLLPAFDEPSMRYGTVAGAASTTMSLVAPLRGFYGEKYFYDAEYMYASYFKNSPALDPASGKIAPNAPIEDKNRLASVSLLGGKKQLLFDDLPEDAEQITDDMFPSPGIPIDFTNFVPLDPSEVLTTGNDYFMSLVPEVSSWVKWKPSFISVMRYNYTLVVTHTCPPFVTYIPGSMLVANNWTPAANRLTYYIALQNGYLDVDYENT